MDTQDRQIIRLMSWERAKGELMSMLQTHVGDYKKHDELKKAIKGFIKDVEDNGKHE